MLRMLLADRALRRAWLLTKLAVLIVAGLATWPLARVVGAKAWLGYGIFVIVVVALTGLALATANAVSAGDETEIDHSADGAPIAEDTVTLPIEDALDLHPFAPAEIPDVVQSYLDEAVARGFVEVRLIHGRGIGVQRARVRSVLAAHPAVIEYHDAPPPRGGWGATVVKLRPASSPQG